MSRVYNLPITKIKINDEEMDAYVDTGAGHLNASVPREDLLRLKAIPTGKEVKFCGCGGQILKAQEYEGSVTLGGKRFDHVILEEYKDWSYKVGQPQEDPLKINAIIGLALLKRFNFLLDFNNNAMILYSSDSHLPPYTGEVWHKVTCFMTSNGLEVPIRIGGAFLRAVMDTGASHSSFIQTHPLIQNDAVKEIGFNEDHFKEVQIKNMKLGNEFFIDDSLTFIREDLKIPTVNFILGHNFFKRYKLFFDFKNETLWIQNA
jgi:hypothetical protein